MRKKMDDGEAEICLYEKISNRTFLNFLFSGKLYFQKIFFFIIEQVSVLYKYCESVIILNPQRNAQSQY